MHGTSGANDVANSFATSMSCRSLTMLQVMMIATVCEFGGAVLAGARVSGTNKNCIIPAEACTQKPIYSHAGNVVRPGLVGLCG